jgi:hypothetical protein
MAALRGCLPISLEPKYAIFQLRFQRTSIGVRHRNWKSTDRWGLLPKWSRNGKRYVIAGGPRRQQRHQEWRQARVAKAELELTRLPAVPRKKVNPQKLASQVGRMLEYFSYRVQENGQLHLARKKEVCTREERRDAGISFTPTRSADQTATEAVLGHYKRLLNIEEAFGELKSLLAQCAFAGLFAYGLD